MKVIFFMAHPGLTRNFDHPIRELARRGHHIHIAFDRVKKRLERQNELVEALAAEWPTQVSYGRAPTAGAKSPSGSIGHRVRLNIDYLRYLGPPFEDADKLRDRAAHHAGRWVRRVAPPSAGNTKRAAVASKLLRLAARSIPVRPSVLRYLSTQKPDVVLITPLVELGSPQDAYVKAARILGIRSMLAVASWDNLTTKGLVHTKPDDVYVWNEDQASEAVELHGIARERIFVAGAWSYDHWFRWQPSTTRAEFDRLVGLPSGQALVTYLGSSEFIAPDEASFITRWVKALRAAQAEELRSAAVLIRPHPTNPIFEGAGGRKLRALLRSDPNLVVWPPDGANPTSSDLRSNYFDTLFHSDAIVGVNTSGLVESAILGKAVLTVRDPQFRETQEGTVHFGYLARDEKGFLWVSDDLDAHVAQLRTALRLSDRDERSLSFVQGFIRPLGRNKEATSALIDEVERRALMPVAATQEPFWVRMLWPLVALPYLGLLRKVFRPRVRKWLIRFGSHPAARRVLRHVPLARRVAALLTRPTTVHR
jgi:hypothetical protein